MKAHATDHSELRSRLISPHSYGLHQSCSLMATRKVAMTFRSTNECRSSWVVGYPYKAATVITIVIIKVQGLPPSAHQPKNWHSSSRVIPTADSNLWIDAQPANYYHRDPSSLSVACIRRASCCCSQVTWSNWNSSSSIAWPWASPNAILLGSVSSCASLNRHPQLFETL